MQLASQRPHPPPVPPRPSRQVVAAALKKSPRPPCPTREAPPPPPNKKPWRSEDQEVAASGRIVVYESVNSREEIPTGERASNRVAPSERSVSASTRSERPQPVGKNAAQPTENKPRQKPENSTADDSSRPGEDEPSPTGSLNGREKAEETSKDECNCDKSSLAKKKAPVNATYDGIRVESRRNGAREVRKKRPNGAVFEDDGATVVVIDEAVTRVCEESDNIRRQDWLEAGVRYSSTKITLPGEEPSDRLNGFSHPEVEEAREKENRLEFGDLDFSRIIERIEMSSVPGLPPLPRSLSGFNLNVNGSDRSQLGEPPPPPTRSSSKSQSSPKPTNSSTSVPSSSRPSPPTRQMTTLDTQLAILRREMYGLRQLDLSLLSQLWSLNESIQEFRQLLQDQEDPAPSPSPSSDEGDDTSYELPEPPPPPRRPPSTSTQHHHHRHRSSRSQKPSSDGSPSSEEYGAV